ncbi:MAG: hypothetical protein N3E47_01015 [Candidatus Bathyarchaeota archaeon]|nr:hypothetical protein [Candidatus Bathyarchaeota archaeon]
MKPRKIFQVNNVCALCEEDYPRSVLYVCHRCGMTYCGNCILFEGGEITCLRCAVREVYPKVSRNKYMNLSLSLAKRARFLSELTLSFREIEEIIGDKLPDSAYKHKGWWSNVRGRLPSEAWLTVGWMIKEVDLEKRMVKFIREKPLAPAEDPSEASGRGMRKSASFKTLALKAKARIRKPSKISKTKIAMLQARLKNIERLRQAKNRRWKKINFSA